MLCLVAVAGNAAAMDEPCLKGDKISSVTMVTADKALVTDRQNGRFELTFVGACGARHQNVFFVLRPESLPVCIGPGTALATNKDGVCVVKTINTHS